jgi:sugar transferase EpsL
MNRVLKRLMDIAGALVALIVFSPLMLWASVMIYFTMGGPLMFRQIRPGLHEKPFSILKFRTMRNAVDASGKPLSDAERLTGFGTRMRQWSIDELPQFINILKGEMSFVGPRPLLFEFFEFYTPEEMRRHEVKPGITGWAQVHGRNNLDWDSRLKLDVWYVDHWNIWLDIRIILKTVLTVIRREGITTEGHATFLRLDDDRRAKREAAAQQGAALG